MPTIELKTITRSKIGEFLERQGDRIFTVHFVKQDGTLREMNARFKEGHTRARYIDKGTHHNCLTVWDMQKDAFRQITLSTVSMVKAQGEVYIVTG